MDNKKINKLADRDNAKATDAANKYNRSTEKKESAIFDFDLK